MNKKEILISKNKSTSYKLSIIDKFDDINYLYSNTENVIFLYHDSIKNNTLINSMNLSGSVITYNSQESLIKSLKNAVSYNQKVIWFTSKDHETVFSNELNEIKELNYDLIPITPIAQITSDYIYNIFQDKIIEILPVNVIKCIESWTKSEQQHYIDGLAATLRIGIEKSSNIYEWFINNMYEVFDKEPDFIYELLEKKADLTQKDFNKLTLGGRCVPHFGSMFEYCIQNACKTLTQSDIISLSCLMHAYIGWGKKMLSMEEFYEIRDMFVAFDMSISETIAKAEDIIKYLEDDTTIYSLKSIKEFPYLKKIGKTLPGLLPSESELLDAAKAVYFDEEEMA